MEHENPTDLSPADDLWLHTLAVLLATLRLESENLYNAPDSLRAKPYMESILCTIEAHFADRIKVAPDSLEAALFRNDVELQRNLRMGVEQQIGVAQRMHRMVDMTELRVLERSRRGFFAALFRRIRVSQEDQRRRNAAARKLIERTLTVTRLVAIYISSSRSRDVMLTLRQSILEAADLALQDQYDTHYASSALWNIGMFRKLIQEANDTDLDITERYEKQTSPN